MKKVSLIHWLNEENTQVVVRSLLALPLLSVNDIELATFYGPQYQNVKASVVAGIRASVNGRTGVLYVYARKFDQNAQNYTVSGKK